MRYCRAALLLALFLLLFLLLLPCAGASAPEEPIEQPALASFALGFSRISEQLQGGRALNTLLTVSPGYLPVADRGAANGLRQMFAGARFGYQQRGLGEACEQSLRIWVAGEPVLVLDHRAEGNRRVWSSPQLLPEGVWTPADVNLFAELLGQAALGEAVFTAPSASAGQDERQLASLQRLLEANGREGADFALTPAMANRALDAWLHGQTYGGLLRPLIAGWRVTEPVQASCKLDDRGRLVSFRISAQLADPDGQVWNLHCDGSQGPGRRQYDRRLNATLSRGKSNTLKLSATVTVTEQAKDQLRQALKLTCDGTLNGHSVNLRLNGGVSNRFLLDGDTLTEQIDGSYTLDWKAREPDLARLGLDEWKVTLGVKSTLRTGVEPAASAVSAVFEGNLSLAMTRSRKDFLSADAWFRANTAEHRPKEELKDAAAWERLGEEELEALHNLRALMRRQVAGMLITNLDTDTQEGLRLK